MKSPVFDIYMKHLWKNSLFPTKHYFREQQMVNTIACFSPTACSPFWLWKTAFSFFLLGASLHVLHVPSSCISLSISVFPLFLCSAWERQMLLARFPPGWCGLQLLAAHVVPSRVFFTTLSLALSHFLLVFHQDLPLIKQVNLEAGHV